jgi:hypothetical protein
MSEQLTSDFAISQHKKQSSEAKDTCFITIEKSACFLNTYYEMTRNINVTPVLINHAFRCM